MMRLKTLPLFRSFQVIAVVLATATGALALDPAEMFDDPAREARAREIGRSLRCLVCQNQSIFDSNAGLAKDLRVVVRQRIEAGDSDEEVIEFVAARYGDFVLLEPPVAPRTFLLWAAPLIFLAAGAGLFVAYHRGRSGRPRLGAQEQNAARRILEGDGS